jgi:hypothetical protein
MQGYACKGGKREKSDRKKIGITHLLEAWEATFKYDGKGGKGARRRGKWRKER